MNATERKVFAFSTFVAACICFGPRQWVSGAALLVVSVVFFIVDRRLSKREKMREKMREKVQEKAAVKEVEAPKAEPEAG